MMKRFHARLIRGLDNGLSLCLVEMMEMLHLDLFGSKNEH